MGWRYDYYADIRLFTDSIRDAILGIYPQSVTSLLFCEGESFGAAVFDSGKEGARIKISRTGLSDLKGNHNGQGRPLVGVEKMVVLGFPGRMGIYVGNIEVKRVCEEAAAKIEGMKIDYLID